MVGQQGVASDECVEFLHQLGALSLEKKDLAIEEVLGLLIAFLILERGGTAIVER